MQIGAGLRASGMQIPVVHPVQLVWEAMRQEQREGRREKREVGRD